MRKIHPEDLSVKQTGKIAYDKCNGRIPETDSCKDLGTKASLRVR